MYEIEEEFDLRVPDEAFDLLRTVGQAVEYIYNRILKVDGLVRSWPQVSGPVSFGQGVDTRPMQRSMARIGLRPTSALNISGMPYSKAVMAEQLVHLMGDADEGRLSKVSAQAVSGRHWRAAVELRVPNFIMLGLGEESSGGRMRQSNLAGAMEALLGRVSRFRFDAARSFIIPGAENEIMTRLPARE